MPQPSIKKNFAYKSLLTISTYLMAFVTFPYVSRVLGVERIGLVSFVENTVNYFLLFATMGIGLLGVREIAAVKDRSRERDRVYSDILSLNLIFTFVTLFVYVICIYFVPKFYASNELFCIGAVRILFNAFLVEWFFSGVEDFRYITLRSLVVKVLYVIAVFLFVRNRDDYYLYFLLTVAVTVVNAVVNMLYIRRFVRFRVQGLSCFRYLRQNVTLGIYTLMTSMYLTFNVMFLGLVSDNVQVGYYSTAHKLYMVILGFFTAFTQVMLPRMSALLSEGNEGRFRELIDKSFSFMLAFIVPLILCSMALAPQIVYVLSGAGYEGAVLPMRILMPAALAVGIAQVLAVQVLMPMRRDKILLVASVVGASVSLLINFTVVPFLQSTGTAIVLVLSECAVTATYMVYVFRHHLAGFPLKRLFQSLFGALPPFGVCLLCGHLISNPYLCVGWAVLFSGIVWGLGCLSIKNDPLGEKIRSYYNKSNRKRKAS